MTGYASRFGLFKLKGVSMQFQAILALYHLLMQYSGDILENDLDWALYNMLETLLRPEGLENQSIDCPTDQMLFSCFYLSGQQYRIADHLQSICVDFKCGFHCIDIYIAHVEVLQFQHKLTFFYTDLSVEQMGREDVQDDNRDKDSRFLKTEAASSVSVNADMASILNKLDRISVASEFH